MGRLRRQRRRRPARHHGPAALPARPRRRRRLDLPVLPLADGRRRVRRRRLRGHRPGVRAAGGRRRSHRAGDRARAQGHGRPGPQPHLRRARLVQGGAGGGPGSPERARYIFRDGKGPNGEQPPNNWPSVFGGIGWTRVVEADGQPGQWYLHLFDIKQPDLNWANPAGPRRVPRHSAVLAGPWRGRLPGRRGARTGQGPGAAGLGRGAATARLRGRRGDRPRRDGRAAAPVLGPGRRPRDLRGLAQGPRRVRPADAHPLRRGLGTAGGAADALRPPDGDAPVVQLRVPRRALGRPGTGRDDRPLAGGVRRRSGHRRRGCCRTTTSSGTLPASGCPRTSRAPTGFEQRTCSRTPRSGCAAPGPPRR